MTSLNQARGYLGQGSTGWWNFRLADLQFWHSDNGRLVMVALVALAIVILVARTLLGRQPGRHSLVVPAVLPEMAPSYLRFSRHLPLLLFFTGVPLLAIALADPYQALVRNEVSYPGRRIALMIDASLSMRMPFKTQHLNTGVPSEATFFTTVA